MGEFDLSSSLSGAAMAAYLAQSAVRSPLSPEVVPSKETALAAVGGTATTLARPTQLTDAVQAALEARTGSSRSTTLDASQAAQGSAQARQEVNASLGALLKDVGKLVRSIGVSETSAREVDKRLAVALSEKMADVTTSPLAQQAASGSREDLVLAASRIEIAINNRSETASATVDDLALTTRADFLSGSQPAYDAYGTGTYGSSPVMVGLDGRSAELETAPDGVYFDVRGESGRTFAALLEPSGTAGARAAPERAEPMGRPARAAETLFASGGSASSSSEGVAGSGLSYRVDGNQDGMADQQDSSYQSLLIMRSGGGLSPLAEGGVTRFQFDAATQIAARVDSSGLVPSVEASRKNGSITPTPEAGLDLKA